MDTQELKKSLESVVEWLRKEFLSIRTGVASPMILDNVRVESYGVMSPLNQVGSVSAQDAKTLFVSIYDKNLIKTVENAIMDSGLGLSASATDSGVRISFPDLTVERKGMLVKLAKEKLEAARVSVRSERDKFNAQLNDSEKAGEISEDQKFSLKEQMESAVKDTNSKLEETFKTKESEINQ